MGVQQKKDVYKISHDFKINTTANKNTHFILISPVDIKIGYFLRFRCKIIFKIKEIYSILQNFDDQLR